MKGASAIAVLLIGGVVGWYLPGQLGPVAPPAPAASAAPIPGTSGTPSVRTAEWSGDALTIPRAEDGHFYATALIDDTQTRMLVDTGASVVALSGEDAEALGYRWDVNDLQLVAHGAGGDVYGVPVTIGRIQLGDIEQRDVAAVIVPEGLPLSLLGQSFLARIDRVEMGPNSMAIGG